MTGPGTRERTTGEDPSANARRVVAVVVTHNSAGVLAECLDALSRALEGIGHEVVVVDNASSDDTLALAARRMPTAVLVARPDNRGYAAGVNAGVEAATSPFDAVLVLNPDTRLQPGSVEHLLDALDHPATGIAVPRIVDGAGKLDLSLRRAPSVLRAAGEALFGGRAGRFDALGEVVADPSAYERAGTAAWASGAVMAISRRCLDAVGPWDESFFLYSEETDFCLRAGDAGFDVRFVLEAGAVHLGGESGTSPPLYALLTVNRVALYRKRHPGARAVAFEGAVMLNEVVRLFRRGGTHRAALGALVRGRAPLPGSSRPQPPASTGFLCFSAQDWWYFNRAHSDFQLMLRVAEKRPVLLVNSIGMRMPLPGRSTQPLKRVLRKAASVAKLVRRPLPELPNFHVMTPVFVPVYGNRLARTLNARLVRLQVSVVARRLGLHRPACIVTLPTAWEVVQGMDLACVVYNRSDKHSEFTEAEGDYVRSLESQLLREADAVVYTSHALMDEEADISGDRAVFLDHGVDLDHFRLEPSAGEPPDLAVIARPRVGFFGELEDYTVDLDLLEKVAVSVPEANLVLIGNASCSMKRLQALPNVHWLGFRPYQAIPAYGAGFDVALMPWLDNAWIRYCNPIKLKEYLALGLPVVSTRFPEVERYRDVVSIAADAEDFVARVRAELRSTGSSATGARRARVAGATWEASALTLQSIAESAALRALGRLASSGSHPSVYADGPSTGG